MRDRIVRVGVIGTGKWAEVAHLPAFERCRNAEVVAICGHDPKRNEQLAKRFGIQDACVDHHDIVERSDIDAIDIATSTPRHFPLAMDAIESGKAILCEKPLAMTCRDAQVLCERAAARGVRTKIGFTFRYSPVIRRMKELIDEGFIGEPYLFNGFEQNSQFIDPKTPFRWNPGPDSSRLMPGSLEEYAPHLIDLGLWLMGDMKRVLGRMKNFIPERMIRDAGKMMSINTEDACVWLGEFRSGAQATFQTSFVAVGGYPGIEIRVWGSKGALIGRLTEEFGVSETLRTATPSRVEFEPADVPDRLYPSGYARNESWILIYFGNLIQNFVRELLNDREPEGSFRDGAKSQEIATAVHLSHLEERWIPLPLE